MKYLFPLSFICAHLRHPRINILLVSLLCFSPRALACAVCFGASDSVHTQGMNAAILTLLGFMAAVFIGIALFVVRMARRMRDAAEGAP